MENSGQTRAERRATARAERERVAAARSRQRQRLWILGGILAVAAAVVVVIAIASGGSDTPTRKAGESLPGQFEANARFADVQQSGITLGNPRAPVTMVEFADLQCPFCREYTTTVFPKLVAEYVRTGRVKMVFRNVSILGSDSTTAARMAAAAGLQNKLWTYIDIWYANQGEENSGYVTDDFMTRVARAVRGLDVQRALRDRDLPQIERQLTEAQTQMTINGFQGTPAFVVGPTGGRLDALQFNSFTPQPFEQAINAALQASKSQT